MHPTWAGELFHPRKVTLVVKMSRSHLTHPFTLPLQTQVQSLRSEVLSKPTRGQPQKQAQAKGKREESRKAERSPYPFREVGSSRRGGQQSTTGGYTPGITQEHQSGVGWQ